MPARFGQPCGEPSPESGHTTPEPTIPKSVDPSLFRSENPRSIDPSCFVRINLETWCNRQKTDERGDANAERVTRTPSNPRLCVTAQTITTEIMG